MTRLQRALLTAVEAGQLLPAESWLVNQLVTYHDGSDFPEYLNDPLVEEMHVTAGELLTRLINESD